MKAHSSNYARKYLLKLLAKLAQQLGHAEDSVAALSHSGDFFQFISHARTCQSLYSAQEVAQTRHGDTAVELALLIAQADDHIGPAELWVDHFFQALQKRRIVVERGDSVDQFRFHEWLSMIEGGDIGLILKYVAKVLRSLYRPAGAA